MPLEDVSAAIRHLLVNDSTIGGMVGDRVTPTVLDPGSELPAVRTAQVAGTHFPDLDGDAGGAATSSLQIDCYGNTLGEARKLARLVRALFSSYSGAVDGFWVDSITKTSGPIDSYDNPKGGAANVRPIVTMRFDIFHGEN